MKKNFQLIERDGKPEWAVLPYDEYLKLLENAEMLEDIRDYDAAKTALENNEEQLVPSEVVFSILDGRHPIRVWRDFRSLTQAQLALAAGVSKPYLSQIETGKRAGTTEVLADIARALDLTLDEIVIQESNQVS
jgi:DNA-binding XRE family transcriptional regulator